MPAKKHSPDSFPLLDFPQFQFIIRESAGKREIFDSVRKKYVALTPEEWVRQHTLRFLQEKLNIPPGLIVVEKSLTLNTLSKRADILVYTRDLMPCMLVECKSANCDIKQDVFEQIARYNIIFKVKYLFVTNGIMHFVFSICFDDGKITALQHFPDWNDMNITKED